MDTTTGQHPDDQPRTQDGTDQAGGQVSESGSSSLNAETALGGADSVPDTPDVNDTGEGDAIDTREPEGWPG